MSRLIVPLPIGGSLSDSMIEAIVDTIFKERTAEVAEAYSAFGREPIEFHSAQEVCDYAYSKRSADGYVHLSVRYPDMAGTMVQARVDLNPELCEGHAYRYVAEGWGLISVFLSLSPTLESRISANSEKRAITWAQIYPDLDAPATWNWPAVARHVRRLRRALKIAT
jgi:hypothetical protein